MRKEENLNNEKVEITIVNAISGNEFTHVLHMKRGYTYRDVKSQDKFKHIMNSFQKRNSDGDRIFYAKDRGDFFDKQDVFNDSAAKLKEKSKPILAAQRKEGEALAKASSAATKKQAKLKEKITE